MRGASQSSRDAVVREFDPVISAAGKDGVKIAIELYAVVDALDSSASLRRALTDPGRPQADKKALVADVFSAYDPRTIDVVSALAAARWSAESDLAEAVDAAATTALLASAETAGDLGRVEEELFRIQRTLAAESPLLTALSDLTATAEARQTLAADTVSAKATSTTKALLNRAVGSPRGRKLIPTLEHLVEQAAERSDRAVAQVSAAVELSAHQRQRLQDILKDAYQRDIRLNVSVDPMVIGGIRIQIGSEVVDGTILSRLDTARQKLVG